MDKEFERCCRLMAKIMEKYSSKILCDIEREIQYRPERWTENSDEKKSRFIAYKEIELAKKYCDLSEKDIGILIKNAIEVSFADDNEKERLNKFMQVS